MGAEDLIRELHRSGAILVAIGDRLRVTAPAGTLTPELRARLREHKSNLLRLLQPIETPPPPAQGKSEVAPRFRFARDEMDFGDVCAGWTPHCWATELRRKADRCDAYRPDIAKWYRDWAADIETRLQERRP